MNFEASNNGVSNSGVSKCGVWNNGVRDNETADVGDRRAAEEPKVTAIHIKTLKLYVAILTLFLISVVGSSVTIAYDSTWAIYVYYSSSVGNPIMYYVLVEKFRTEVKSYCNKLVRCH